MEQKVDIEHQEDAITERDPAMALSQRPTMWSYLAATGLIFSWLAETQLFSQSSLLLSFITADLGANKEYPWIFESYLFVAAILSPPAGALADYFGRKWFLIIGNLIAIVGAIVCATAQSVNVVIVGMCIAGVGCTGQHFAIAGISELFPRKHRALAQGVLQFSVIPFIACGSIFSAEMALHTTWRWTYYLYILISGLALVMTSLFYDPLLPKKNIPPSTYLKTLDWIQPITIVLAIVGWAVGGGFAFFGIYPWSNARVLVPLFLGFPFVAIFIYRVQTYKGPNPLFPKDILGKDTLSLLMVGAMISFSTYTATFTWTDEVEYVYTTDLLKVGKYNFPAGFGTELGVLISSLVMRAIGHTKYQLTTACFFVTLFVALLATLTPHSITPGLVYLSFAGVANGFLQVILPTMIQLVLPDKHIGAVTGLIILARYIGGAAGILMSLTIIRSRAGFTLVPNIEKAALSLGLPETSLASLLVAIEAQNEVQMLEVPGVTLEIIEAVIFAVYKTYSDAFRIIYYPILGVSVAAIVLAFLFAPDVTPLMDNSLALLHGRPWFLRRRVKKTG